MGGDGYEYCSDRPGLNCDGNETRLFPSSCRRPNGVEGSEVGGGKDRLCIARPVQRSWAASEAGAQCSVYMVGRPSGFAAEENAGPFRRDDSW